MRDLGYHPFFFCCLPVGLAHRVSLTFLFRIKVCDSIKVIAFALYNYKAMLSLIHSMTSGAGLYQTHILIKISYALVLVNRISSSSVLGSMPMLALPASSKSIADYIKSLFISCSLLGGNPLGPVYILPPALSTEAPAIMVRIWLLLICSLHGPDCISCIIIQNIVSIPIIDLLLDYLLSPTTHLQ